MTRPSLITANRNAASADSVVMVDLIAIAFPAPLSTLRLASGDMDVTFGGNTYLADGTLGEAGAAEETTDLRPRTLDLTLSGARANLIAALRANTWQYVRVDGWLGFLNANTGALVADPFPIAPDLRASTANIVLDRGTATVTLEVEGRELALARDSGVLATHATQLRRYAGDTGLSLVAAIVDKKVQWGGRTQTVGSAVPRTYTGVPNR